ncbi:MAG: Abi family protein [Anaerococcus vaginalis]|nr:Abi family protein [Anaerococcus vaginalis]
MKEYKTFNQQLVILRKRGLIVPKDGRPKRFLEQENYYNVINGYKDLFLQKDSSGNLLEPETYLPNVHFNELKALFLFDRELRILFLKYILIFENSFKTVISHEFSKKYPKPNSYLEIKNYVDDRPKKVLQQISILTKTIHDKVDKDGAIKHYIEEHGSVPLWVLVNYLTIGNLAHLYDILVDTDKNTIAKYYSDKYKKQYKATSIPRFSSEYLGSALKIINLVRNKCAHDERLYNSNFGNVKVANIARYYGCNKYDNKRIIVAIFYLKVLLDKKYFQKFGSELKKIFDRYQNEFNTVAFSDVLSIMGIDLVELQKLM